MAPRRVVCPLPRSRYQQGARNSLIPFQSKPTLAARSPKRTKRAYATYDPSPNALFIRTPPVGRTDTIPMEYRRDTERPFPGQTPVNQGLGA